MFFEMLRIALRSLGSNKMRTFLSMLGIIIGVGAVIAVISIGTGSQQQVTSRISAMGSNLIHIQPRIRRGMFGQLSSDPREIFTLELGEAINDYCPSVLRSAPVCQASGHFIVGGTNYRANLVGTSIDYLPINDYRPELGKFFSGYDLDHATNVIVLGSEIVAELFENENPIGQKILFLYNNHTFSYTVIGVMEEKERGLAGNLNTSAYIPITTYLHQITNNRYVNNYLAQAVSAEAAGEAVEEIRYLLTRYLNGEEDFSITSQDQLLETISEVTATMTLMLAGIAAISLLVGGIGIMNIMLVSVTERTKEIGIRKALGAKRKHIMSQFLIEALTLSCLGGLLGIILGDICAYFIARLGGWAFVISPASVILALGFSLTVGVFFGIYPAFKAAGLDPVIALSYE